MTPKHRLGWLPDVPDKRDFVYKAAPRPWFRALPASVDLRANCPSVYDQGDLGSCTANAIAAAVQFDRLKQKLPNFVPSRLFLYYNERAMEGSVDSDAGAEIRDGIKSVAKQGDCREPSWPYVVAKFRSKPPLRCYRTALKYQAISYFRVGRSLGLMKACLADGFPFVFGFSVYENVWDPDVDATGNIPPPAGSQVGGHAMLAIGYGGSRFIVRNSWGRGWGAKGYGTIGFEYLLDPNLSDDFWTIRVVT